MRRALREEWWGCPGEESASWCEVGVCVLAAVLSVPTLASLVDVVCELDFFFCF